MLDLDRRPDGVAVVHLDRPPANALSKELLRRLADAAAELTRDPPGAVVVTGGDRIFAAGADIAELGGPDDARTVGAHFREALDSIAAIPRITIAAVSGYALGGGCELAMACDLRVADARAKLGQPEVLLGIIPGGGGTQRMARLVGPARAKELMATGRQVGADEALRIGLVDLVAAEGQTAFDAAVALATALAAGPVQAQARVKRAVDVGLGLPLVEGLDLEQELFVDVFGTDDAAIGVRSFLEHGPGKATFTGR
jgi:enoyl-CoA hydratase/carnithine racemase